MKISNYDLDIAARDVAIDVGTSNTQIYVQGKGVVLDEPSVVALDWNTRKVVAAGSEAKQLAVRDAQRFPLSLPICDSVISDYEMTSAMIRAFLAKATPQYFWWHPKLLLTVPTGLNGVGKLALIEAAEKAGAGRLFLIEGTVAAAIGTGLRVDRPRGCMVVDIGGGTTEVAVLCASAVIKGESLPVAGRKFSEAIRQYVRHEHRVDISETMAERVKIKLGPVMPLGKERQVQFCGRGVASGNLRRVILTDQDVRRAIQKPLLTIIDAIKRVLHDVSPDLALDIAKNGIRLTGGGALLKGLPRLLREQVRLAVQLAPDPSRAAIRGAGAAAEQFAIYRRILQNGKPSKLRYSIL